MKYKGILIVTFPVDLGNKTIEANLMNIFKEDAVFFRFAEEHVSAMEHGKIGYWQSLFYKIKSVYKLRKTVSNHIKQGKLILFYGISPALFSFGIWNKHNAAITFDWNRTLMDFAYKKEIKRGITFYIQKKILKNFTKLLCCTDTLILNLIEVYTIKKSSIFKVPAPLLIQNMNIYPRDTPIVPKVLFVGGDLKRKGGDLLLTNWKTKSCFNYTLTMMTNDKSANLEGINYLPGIKYGTEQHFNVFKEHDILILPTTFDSYPQVIGEAAAAGLTIITTKYALLSSEVIINDSTGYICNTPEECISKLEELVQNKALMDTFKLNSYNHIHSKFEKNEIRSQYLDSLS